jgi:hypothetical protein
MESVLASVPAEVIDYLDEHSGSMTALLTLALVLVTIYYTSQNRRMVHEMAATRKLTVLPKGGGGWRGV